MTEAAHFGEWIAGRRKQLDLTQRDLAARTQCALSMIKKIETGERRPSRELAESLAAALRLPTERTAIFVACARGLRSVDALSHVGTVEVPTRTNAFKIPYTASPLIGRARELAEIAERLSRPECRWLTLVGIGRGGQDLRLAVAAAGAERDSFADGVAVVPLAAVSDIGLVPTAIAESLGIAASGPAQSRLAAYLRDKVMLLVLDNCEQLREGVGVLAELLAQAPGLKLLTTSRERLNLVEEWVYAVPPLEDSQAVALFEHTARRLAPRFSPAGQGDAIAAICRSVGALPLAVELAAGWTPVMTTAEIAERLRRDLDLLHGTEQNLPERHRSLRVVFDNTWSLLPAREQQALMRLSVFRSGWVLAEGEAIADASVAVVRALVDRALVQVSGDGRFDLHPLVQQYASERLQTAGLQAEAWARHAEAFLRLAGELDAQLHTADGITAFARLDREQDNLRAGLQRTYDAGDVDRARRFFDKLSLYWWRRGHWGEGEHWARALDARPGEADSALLCWAQIDAAFFLTLQGHYTEAIPYVARAEAMAERLADPETTLRVLIVQAQAPLDIDTAAALYERFFAMAALLRAHSKSGLEAMAAAFHDIHGDRLREAGQSEAAAAQYRESLALWKQMGNVDAIAYPIGNLGRLALHAGRVEEAAANLHDCVAIARAIGNRVGIIDWLPHLGSVLLTQGDVAQAEACYDEALTLCDEVGSPVAAAQVSAYLAYCALLNGDVTRSREALRRSLTTYHAVADTQAVMAVPWRAMLPFEFVLGVQVQALLDLDGGVPLRAVQGLSAAERWQLELGEGPDLGRSKRVEQALEMLRDQLAPDVFAEAWRAGRSLTPGALIDRLLEPG